jgi:purine-binding chemotaxis protein CheW
VTDADKLRADFDGGFAVAPETTPDVERFIAVRLGTAAYLVPLSQMRSVARMTPVTPAPSSRRELLGVVPERGAVLAVFDLAPLLGHPPQTSPRWLVTVRDRVAFAIEHVDGYVVAPRGSITGEVVALAEGTRPILRLQKLADSLAGKET